MDQIMWLRMEADEMKDADKAETEPLEQISLGEYTITHYCSCSRCCGKEDGVTATGTQATEGRTIAVDPEIIPYGTKVLIDGHEYIAEDTGGAIKGNKIDIYVDSHQEAVNRGRVVRGGVHAMKNGLSCRHRGRYYCSWSHYTKMMYALQLSEEVCLSEYPCCGLVWNNREV